MDKTIGVTLGDYYRDLSLNYSDYYAGTKQWPERPAGWYDPLGYDTSLAEHLAFESGLY